MSSIDLMELIESIDSVHSIDSITSFVVISRLLPVLLPDAIHLFFQSAILDKLFHFGLDQSVEKEDGLFGHSTGNIGGGLRWTSPSQLHEVLRIAMLFSHSP